MKKKRIMIHSLAMATLVLPNTVYLAINGQILKEANVVSLTMVAILTLSVIGIGALSHIKLKGGIWVILISFFILALSNIANIAGTALLIEGICMSADGYIFKPIIEKLKIREFEDNGGTITYTKEFK